MIRTHRKSAFTLVEILIVVVILGILAAIVIPQFTSASETAKGSALVSTLQTLRSQLELYQVQHNGDYPTDWAELTSRTDSSGTVMATDGDTSAFPYGPYLQQPSKNPFASNAEGTTIDGVGWEYDSTTGEVRAKVESNDKAIRAGLIDSGTTIDADHPDFVVDATMND